MSIQDALLKLVDGHDLSREEAQAAMRTLVDGEATPSQIAGFAVALRMKGETAEEIAGLAHVMREAATRVDAGSDVVDVVGTGGDGAGTFNISTISAFVVASAGGRVAKHGNRGVTSACGAADFLEAHGRGDRPAARGRRALRRRDGLRLHVRAAVPPGHAPRRRAATRDRRADRVQHPRPADEPGRAPADS